LPESRHRKGFEQFALQICICTANFTESKKANEFVTGLFRLPINFFLLATQVTSKSWQASFLSAVGAAIPMTGTGGSICEISAIAVCDEAIAT
jgi:hypothetical protein